MKIALLLTCLLLLTGCWTEEWIQVNQSRPAVHAGDVQFLDGAPKRPYEVIGIITPVAGEYPTEAAAVKAMRKQAAKRGANALFIESRSESGAWNFGTAFGGMSDGSYTGLRLRAKAIVWK